MNRPGFVEARLLAPFWKYAWSGAVLGGGLGPVGDLELGGRHEAELAVKSSAVERVDRSGDGDLTIGHGVQAACGAHGRAV